MAEDQTARGHIERTPIREVPTEQLEQHLNNPRLLSLICEKTGSNYRVLRSSIKRELARRSKSHRSGIRAALDDSYEFHLAKGRISGQCDPRLVAQEAGQCAASSSTSTVRDQIKRHAHAVTFEWQEPSSLVEPSTIRVSTALHFIPDDRRAINPWRLQFLREMDLVAPHIWKELESQADPLLAEVKLLRSRLNDGGCAAALPALRQRLLLFLKWQRTILQLREMVLNWSKSHNLGDTWVPRYAWQRLARESAEWIQGAVAGLAPAPHLPALAELQPPRWDPFSETEADFRKRVGEYVAIIKGHLSNAGARAFRQANRRDLQRLVRWHILRESPETIAKREVKNWHVRKEDIRHVVKELAERLGLPDRPAGKRGRPRKNPRGPVGQ